jgi:hypothetical protein
MLGEVNSPLQRQPDPLPNKGLLKVPRTWNGIIKDAIQKAARRDFNATPRFGLESLLKRQRR